MTTSTSIPRAIALVWADTSEAPRSLAGVPLLTWTLQAICDSNLFAEIWVATRDVEAAAVAESLKARVFAPLSNDRAVAARAFLEEIPGAEVLAVFTLDDPLLQPADLRRAYVAFTAAPDVSAVAGAMRLPDDSLANTGSLAIYRDLKQADIFPQLPPDAIRVDLPRPAGIWYSAQSDWQVLELLACKHGYRRRGKTIRLVVLDVDGVLTDAGFYYSETGEALKKFNTRDGAGIVQLRNAGVELGIITGESTGFAPARAEKLGIKRVELGCKNKLPVLDAWRRELKLEWDEIAYMGDDLADIPCIAHVGVGACPSDAEPQVRQAARFVSSVPGGRGCVRDLVRFLIDSGRVRVGD